jgi:hypothetical protein
MDICPECGYEDEPIWRNTLRRLYSQHCHISDLDIWNPQLAEKLKKEKYVFLNGVKFKLNKKGSHVHRIAANKCKYPSPRDPRITEPDTEKAKARMIGRLPNQQRLQ